ncbi:hypothetical protein EW026_g5516 [Hermanssonia centrifuga]|uniref:Uncharacterized protein n=1 Tax=Hermanssonia centrifuga TaxID=98765 RepID=A0A4S4KE44_9APHY|nr:hypothetical protein EW026_g5516 [Hermanssonia centrifuga]
MLQLLTDEGAHIEWEEDMWHRTPLQLLQQSSPPQQYQESHIGLAHPLQIHIAGPIFNEDIIDSWEDWLERCDFPDVHRAVLTHRTRNMSLRDMLLGTAADINAPCRMGVTPLEWCIWMGIPNVLETLLQCGADVYEGCPLHLAASSGDVEALKLLVHAGADINLQDTDGATPLHMAAYYGKAEYVKELIRIGGDDLDLGALDHCYGNTALDIARAGRIKCEEMGWPTDDRDKIILALLELQASSGGRRMPEHSDVTNAYIEMVEDLCMPGSFPVD